MRLLLALPFVMSATLALAQETTPALQPPAPASDAAPPASPSAPAPDEAARNAVVLSAISALAPMIGDVQIVGPWVEGDRHGIWRTVMTQPVAETSGNRFFVQQIEEKSGNNTVIASTEITEIASIEGAVVGYRADAPAAGDDSNLTLFFDIVPLDGEVSESYELFFSPTEAYRFGPATN